VRPLQHDGCAQLWTKIESAGYGSPSKARFTQQLFEAWIRANRVPHHGHFEGPDAALVYGAGQPFECPIELALGPLPEVLNFIP
jgi:hypothetical protein